MFGLSIPVTIAIIAAIVLAFVAGYVVLHKQCKQDFVEMELVDAPEENKTTAEKLADEVKEVVELIKPEPIEEIKPKKSTKKTSKKTVKKTTKKITKNSKTTEAKPKKKTSKKKNTTAV